MMKKYSLVACGLLGLVAIGLAGFLAYKFVPGGSGLFIKSSGATPVLEIGSVSYAWGGALNTVCPDGRVYTSPTTGSNPAPQASSLVAVLDAPAVQSLSKALGNVSFNYSESFDDPRAFDDEYTAIARRAGPGPKIDFDKTEYDHYSRLVSDLVQAFPARLGNGQVQMRRSHLRRAMEWRDKAALDFSKFRALADERQDAFNKKYFPEADFTLNFLASDLTSGELTALRTARDENPGEFSFDETRTAFFFQTGDPTVVYQISVAPDGIGSGEFVASVRLKKKVVPLKSLAVALGESEDSLIKMLNDWKLFDNRTFKTTGDSAALLTPLTTHDSSPYIGTFWERDGQTRFVQFEYAIDTSPGVSLTVGQNPCALPWPKDLIREKGVVAVPNIVPAEGYAAKSADAEKEAESRAE